MGSIKLFDTLFGPESFPRNVRAVDELKGIAARYDRSLPQLALRWAISHPAVSTALVGCRTVAEVEDNVGAIGWSIGDDDLAEIDAIFERHGVDTVPDYWIEDDCRSSEMSNRWNFDPFGRTGLDVSAVGFGCWEIGGGYGDIEEAEFVRADRPRRSTSASTASTPPRATAWARPSARSGRRSAGGATRRSSSPSSA